VPLFEVFEAGVPVDERRLRQSLALERERTLEQDPMFGLRILVNLALKALSPAINDPTSAIVALNQLHDLLRFVAQRRLDVGHYRDAEGSCVPPSIGRPGRTT
jgi:uncharacterized membrane protein